ncbi:hypothetical protein DQ04_10971000 [Trypanosoma grayi]|uniref:hypothetical protein n=1 Tax=Trypanosoma grayi TaxID=71804 RepID=UPI0004F45D4E|nr:hypothetical protein DQ04_10971000 [Trypanosoma grayi]KEG07086.1 hypothetical protein DQ04_10971000 [Trypanosoma grayi]
MESLLEKLEESSAQLRTQYERVRKMGGDSGSDEAKLDALRTLHDCFLSHTEKTKGEVEFFMTDEEREAEDLEEEVAALEAELLLLTRAAEGRDAGDRTLPALHDDDLVESYQTFSTQLADFTAQLSVMREALQGLLAQSTLQAVAATSLASWCGVTNREAWVAREKQLQAAWKVLSSSAELMGVSASEASMIAAHDLLKEVVPLAKRAVSNIAEGRRAEEERERGVKQVETQQQRLVMWCRQQQANLDALSDPDHVQEFCASLLEHYKVMARNYGVLLDTAEPFLDHDHVQEALLEANEAWVHLQVKVLERIRSTLFEVHAQTLLEEHVEENSSVCLQVGPFLDELLNTLAATRDTASPLYRRCLDLTNECEDLQKMLPEHEELCRRLLSFADRMRVMREAYNCYRAAALSHLTYLSSSSDVLAEAMRRKEEYEGCVEELQAWADEKARCDSWRDIRDKVRDIKLLLEREQQFVEDEEKKTKR